MAYYRKRSIRYWYWYWRKGKGRFKRKSYWNNLERKARQARKNGEIYIFTRGY